MTEQSVIKLHDGNIMPLLGLGVWQASSDQAREAALKALDIGYRSIDTATAYQNESAIGQALKETSIPREQIFITTKLWNDAQTQPEKALETSLKALQLDYLDLWLIHWPCPQQDHYVSAWKAMIKLQQQGLIKSIGVCNFHQTHLKRLINETSVVPVINQIELHPFMQQRELHAWNAMHRIQTEAWSPLAQGDRDLFSHEIIKNLAQKYHKTPAQIIIRWHIDNGSVVIPKSVTPSRIEENFAVFDFRLEKMEMGEIAKLDKHYRLGPDPDHLN